MNTHAEEMEELVHICESIDSDEEGTVVKAALTLSEKPGVSEEVRSLAIDAMLVAQHDYLGEFKSKAHLLEAVHALRDQRG